MTDNLLKLYPNQPTPLKDRRQSSVPVDVDRRSGADRRADSRMNLQPGLQKDVVQIKSKMDELYTAFKGYDIEQNKNIDYYKNFLNNKTPQKASPAIKNEVLDFALSSIPFARRIVNIDKNNKEDNKVKATGLTLIALTNVAEDLRDILTIFGKVKSTAPKDYYSKYGFFVGTSIEDNLQKKSWGKKILQLDRTVGDLDITKRVLRRLGFRYDRKHFDKEIQHLNGKMEVFDRRYVKFFGNRFRKTIGLALYRIPLLSVGVAALLELPNIIKAKKGNKGKQAANSVMSVVLSATTGALLSAALAPINPVLPILGLGAGYYIGGKIAKAIGFKLNET